MSPQASSRSERAEPPAASFLCWPPCLDNSKINSGRPASRTNHHGSMCWIDPGQRHKLALDPFYRSRPALPWAARACVLCGGRDRLPSLAHPVAWRLSVSLTACLLKACRTPTTYEGEGWLAGPIRFLIALVEFTHTHALWVAFSPLTPHSIPSHPTGARGGGEA
jgi:hypothetical protein